MKKVIAAFAVIAIVGTTLISCTKKGDYTCNCTLNVSGQTTTLPAIPGKNVKKSDAQKTCDLAKQQFQAQAAQAGGTADCTLSED